RRLPARLLESFASTLAEIREASLLLVVVDASDPEWDMHLSTTEAMIAQLGAERIPRLYALNKLDRPEAKAALEALAGRVHPHPHRAVSARDPQALEALREALLDAVRAEHRRAQVLVPYAATHVTTRIYAECRVLETEATEEGLALTIEGRAHVIDQIERASEEARA
ncbi:MAG: hypothetical protein KDK70_41900, partial [Myxococcales bacterium]|nr:hypothetical protein [Myxococcales bacterium]